jgi:cytochrome b subunit of formate dehydrogenase
MSRIVEEKNRVVRHGWIELAGHWTIALSGLALLLSGMFELPMAARFGITKIPGFGWSGDFIASLYVHYIASVIFVAAAFFHLVYHGLLKERGLLPQKGDLKASVEVVKTFFGFGEEPPFGKYLPEQRVAYLGMAVVIGMLVLTGLIKTYKNIYAPDLAHTVVIWTTTLHNLFFVLFILAFVGHIGALLLKPNRPMVRGILTGKVRLDYAKQRHPLWIAGMNPPESLPTITKPDEAISATPAPVEAASPDGETSEAETLAASDAGDKFSPQEPVTSAAPETDRDNGGDPKASNPPAA